MRDLTGTDLGEDQKAMGDAKLRLALTKTDQTPYTYYIDSGDDRILFSRHTEQEWSQVAQVAIQDSSHTIADLSPDLRGYKGVIGYGYGANYSDCAPLWCIAQKTDSFGGGIVTSLGLAGTFNLMNEDRASAAYTPDTSNTDTIKTILTAVCEKTLAPFTHCTSYTATFDVSTGIIDTFMPKDSFRVYLNDTRLAVIKRLMQYVGYKCRVEADAQIHFFIPTVSSSTYDYEYDDVVTGHNFYEKSVRKRVVIPNYVVVSSHPDHESPYAGWTGYKADTTDDGDIEKKEYKYFRVTSDAQCVSIATNLLLHHQMDAEKGHGFAPMNCGQEVFDYVNITDSRVGDERSGNIGYVNREYSQGKFTMEFRFGSIAPGQYLGTTPPQMVTAKPTEVISIAALAEQIMTLWDNQMALVDAIIETKQEVIDLEPDAGIPSGGGEGGETWVTAFDGSTDSPTLVAWGFESGLPFTPTIAMYFSPVIEEVSGIDIIYVIDRGNSEFWKYNITEKGWYQLTSPTYTAENCYRTLAINPLGTKLACVSEGGASEPFGRRIEIYTISTDSWTASSQVAIIVSRSGGLKSLVWEDNDTIWAWAKDGTNLKGKCIKYVPSTNTFTVYTNDTGTETTWQGRDAAIKGTTIVYGGTIGSDSDDYHTYTIATDTYTKVSVPAPSGLNYSYTYDKDKLWFVDTADFRQGYIDTADDSVNADKFAENTDRTASYGAIFGVNDAGSTIVAWAKSTTPRLMSVISGENYLLCTLHTNIFTTVKIEKPNDNFAVLCVNTDGNWESQSYDHSAFAWLGTGTWNLYYPKLGDYTGVVIKHGVD